MSTSQCGNICVMPPKCSRNERRRGFSNRSSVEAAMARRHRVFRRKQKHFCVCVCVCVCVSGRHGHTTTACLRKHMSITVCHPLWLELILKLRTLLMVFTFILNAEARDYGKGRYISNECLWCSANHNALGQLANQSRLLVGRRDFVENKAFERGGE